MPTDGTDGFRLRTVLGLIARGCIIVVLCLLAATLVIVLGYPNSH